MITKGATESLCGHVFRQTIGDMSTGGLLFHFRTHHVEVYARELPDKYSKDLEKGIIKSRRATVGERRGLGKFLTSQP